MTLSSIPKKVDESSEEVSKFLNPKKPDDKVTKFMSLVSELDQIRANPDRIEPAAPQQQAVQEEAPKTPQVHSLKPQPQAPAQPAASPEAGAERSFLEDRVSVQSPTVETRGRKAKEPDKLFLEKSFSIDPAVYKRIERITNLEGLRHDARFSVSHVVRHLLDFALAHVENDEVMPTADGKGLHIPDRSKGQ